MLELELYRINTEQLVVQRERTELLDTCREKR